MSVKLAASLLGGGGATATLTWGGATYLSGNGEGEGNGGKSIEVQSDDSTAKTIEEPEAKKEEAQVVQNQESTPQAKETAPKAETAKELPPAKPTNIAEINAKLMQLKNEKIKLMSDVENAISDHNDLMRRISDVSKLESEFDKCFSKTEVESGVTNEQKAKLKSAFGKMKESVGEYEQMKKDLSPQGEVGKSESYADGDNTSEDRYKDFEAKFKKIKEQYENAEKNSAIIEFHTTLSGLKDKLSLAGQTCSFKDIIKINDKLGELNNARK